MRTETQNRTKTITSEPNYIINKQGHNTEEGAPVTKHALIDSVQLKEIKPWTDNVVNTFVSHEHTWWRFWKWFLRLNRS